MNWRRRGIHSGVKYKNVKGNYMGLSEAKELDVPFNQESPRGQLKRSLKLRHPTSDPLQWLDRHHGMGYNYTIDKMTNIKFIDKTILRE